jgi:hypothetical protein
MLLPKKYNFIGIPEGGKGTATLLCQPQRWLLDDFEEKNVG